MGGREFIQGVAKGGRQKEFDHFFRFRDSFGHFLVTFSDASGTFFVTFFAKLLLPDSFCGRVSYPNRNRIAADTMPLRQEQAFLSGVVAERRGGRLQRQGPPWRRCVRDQAMKGNDHWQAMCHMGLPAIWQFVTKLAV